MNLNTRASSNSSSRLMPVEEFLQSLTNQLDRAQDVLAVKVKAGRPLTWALKDLNLELRVFVDVDQQGRVMMRSAGPNEDGASTLNINLTTITRPMVEENTFDVDADLDPRAISRITGAANFDEEDHRRLERLGIRTVGQLKRLSEGTNPAAVESFIGIPVDRLRMALEAAARPSVTGQELVPRGDSALLRIHGANLTDGISTEVRLAGEPVEVVDARPNMLLVRPLAHHQEGAIEVHVNGQKASGYFRLPTKRAPAAPGEAS
jgi:hypothetical protein